MLADAWEGVVRSDAPNPDAAWRDGPATDRQWHVIRRIEDETGQRFPESLTKGQASDIIRRRQVEDPEARRAMRRAYRRRRRERRRRERAAGQSPLTEGPS